MAKIVHTTVKIRVKAVMDHGKTVVAWRAVDVEVIHGVILMAVVSVVSNARYSRPVQGKMKFILIALVVVANPIVMAGHVIMSTATKDVLVLPVSSE